MKKWLALLLTGAMSLSLVACGSGADSKTEEAVKEESSTPAQEPAAEEAAEPAEETAGGATADSITLWTYPIGNWGTESEVKALTDAFTADTGISVTVEYLDYSNGDDKMNTAIAANNAPDLVMEGPERLVANWGKNGYMVDLSDLLDDTDYKEISEAVMSACTNDSGAVYEYPLVMTAHCMAINVDAFKEAGADQYVDLDSHTWSTEDFKNAVTALNEHFGGTVGAVYCAGQGGDQGTRALVNNLYGGTFANAEHTQYTWDDPKNVQALQELYDLEGIDYDASIVGGDEIANFYNGQLKMAFCWNIAQQLNPNGADTGSGLTIAGEEIAFMAFPTSSGDPKLQGGIWGFGVFDNGDEGRINASKEFIKWMCDSEHTADAVKTANYFAVRDTAEGTDLSGIWADNEVMDAYTVLMPYLGDYYQVTNGWAEARTAWWSMLQEVGKGADVTEAVTKFAEEANATASK